MLDDWYGRSPEDRRYYDFLDAQARKHPLDPAVVQSLRQQLHSPGANSLGVILDRQGWFRGRGGQRFPLPTVGKPVWRKSQSETA